jgi:hypothetical protein
LQAAAGKSERGMCSGSWNCCGFWWIVVATSSKKRGSEKENDQQKKAQHETCLVADVWRRKYRFAEMHHLCLIAILKGQARRSRRSV